jgi:riboflavin biosynthesis pyrimidine reductase
MSRFEDYCRRKEEEASRAVLMRLHTVAQDTAGADVVPVGSPWTRDWFDGNFFRCGEPVEADLPSLSLVVGRGMHGAITTGDPMVRGASATTRHLIHEGLSRVDVDAVLGSVGAAGGPDVVFSVWHPELVLARCAAGRYRHPAQVVVTASGSIPFDHCVMFDEPTLKVIVVTRGSVAPSLRARLHDRPWIEVIDAGEPLSLFSALRQLRAKGIRTISAVGGQRTADHLLRDGLVTDLYVTRQLGGAPLVDGRLYEGPPLLRRRLLAKAGCDDADGICFEHLVRPSIYSPPAVV